MKYTVNATKEHYYYIDVEAESPEEAEEKVTPHGRVRARYQYS